MEKLAISSIVLVLIAGICWNIPQIHGHGRIVDPPQRGSLWRLPEYAWANPGHQADDQELLCGGTTVTDPYIGACGLCGDSILEPRPRKHEIGGEYERGLIVRNYTVGQTIPIDIYIAVDHRGWFEFRLCPYSSTGQESEECFNTHLLKFADGSSRLYDWSGQNVNMNLVLPSGLTCDRCVIQWTWFGEGSNQWYRNCADISIH